MRTVYIDVVILVNFCTDYVLLYLTSHFLHIYGKTYRLIFASFVGCFISLADVILLYKYQMLRLLVGIVSSVPVCLVAFGKLRIRTLLKTVLSMYIFSFLLSGVVNFVSSQFYGTMNVNLLLILASCILLAILCKKISGIFKTHVTAKSVDAVVTVNGTVYSLELLNDSGNLLIDPYTSNPIIVLNGCFEERMTYSRNAVRLVPIKTVSGSCLMKVITPDSIIVSGDKRARQMRAEIGFSRDDGGSFAGCDGIISNSLTEII